MDEAEAQVVVRHVDLPLSRLRVASCGSGPPVIIVPATISLIEDWMPLIRFTGQRYSAHFFELPGYGGSSPFGQPYRSTLVAELVEQLADSIGAEEFGMLGFSFGGLLALRSLQRCGDRIERMCLLSPYVGRESLRHTRRELVGVRAALVALRPDIARRGMVAALRSPAALAVAAWFMRAAGRFQTSSDLRARLQAFSPASLDMLLAQVEELLVTPSSDLGGPYETPCLFGMSVNDTTLDYDAAQAIVGRLFPNLTEDRWDFPFHAPPVPFTFEDYQRDFRSLIEWEPTAAARGVGPTIGL